MQGEDPGTDLRSGGLLALHALVYFGEAFGRLFRAAVDLHAPATGDDTSNASGFPVALTVINISARLAQVRADSAVVIAFVIQV